MPNSKSEDGAGAPSSETAEPAPEWGISTRNVDLEGTDPMSSGDQFRVGVSSTLATGLRKAFVGGVSCQIC